MLYTITMFAAEDIINAPNMTNIKINGANTNNHAKLVAPPRQITFNNQVQNKIYSILITNITYVLPTSHI